MYTQNGFIKLKLINYFLLKWFVLILKSTELFAFY